MANEFPVDQTAAEAFDEAMLIVRQARTWCGNLAAATVEGRHNAVTLASFAPKAGEAVVRLQELAAVAGIAAEARARLGDEALNVGAMFTGLVAALTAVQTSLAAVAPPPLDPQEPAVADAIAKLETVVAATVKSA